MPDLGPVQLVIVIALVGAAVSLPLAAIVDAMSFSPGQWQQVGHRRKTWVTLMAVGIFGLGVLGIAVTIEYLRTVRPKLQQAPG